MMETAPRMTCFRIAVLSLFALTCSWAFGQIDPPLAAWSELANDIGAAGGFYRDVTKLEPARDDETLRFLEGDELIFGYASACRSEKDCRPVFVRPLSQIARHWLVKIEADWERFQRLAPTDPKSAKFVADSKQANLEPDAIWMKLTKLYCQLEPQGRYKNLDGVVQPCEAQSGQVNGPRY